ncbi:helix-turn-helix domain-containing protein [Sphingomonas sp. R3G8C]|uniref:AraC family transcriptional regulator n=1 Tax=Novosphingobium rhizosphaerae TaxID=1551649 RepID=UPI001C54BF63
MNGGWSIPQPGDMAGFDGARFDMAYQPAPPDLARYVTMFFEMRSHAAHLVAAQPAGPGVLVFFLRGAGTLHTVGGAADASCRASLLTPLSAAARIEMAGPWHLFGASLSPLGWAALTGGLSAAEHGNRLREAGSLLGSPVRRLGEDLAQAHGVQPLTLAEMVARSAPVLRARLHALPDAHVRLVEAVLAWLGRTMSPVLDDLYGGAFYSPRQLQRLVDRYFGLPPKQLARQYRALRAAALLSDPAITPQRAAAVADHFYDQSHMIREVRLFTGHTPARLAGAHLSVLSAMLAMRNLGTLDPPLRRRIRDWGG